MSAANRFTIEEWAAWAPGLSDAQEWQAYFNTDKTTLKPGEADDIKADVSFLPAMKRRRLSPLARAVFHVVQQLNPNNQQLPSIFCSTYGESQRTYSLLETIARKEDVSPTAFSLSVHNAISGQYTILFGNHAPSTALAPKAEDYLAAFLEARGQSVDYQQAVLLVFYEEALPDFYKPYAASTNFPCAVGLVIRACSDDDPNSFSITLDSQKPARNLEHSDCPPLPGLIRALSTNSYDESLGRWFLNQHIS